MYIKLSFNDVPWMVPQCSAGAITALTEMPEIVDALPLGIQPNKIVNEHKVITQSDNDGYLSEEKEEDRPFADGNPEAYDYYFDCGILNREAIGKVITLFLNSFNRKPTKNKLPSRPLGDAIPQDANQTSDSESESDDEDKHKAKVRQMLMTLREGSTLIRRMHKAIANVTAARVQGKALDKLSPLSVSDSAYRLPKKTKKPKNSEKEARRAQLAKLAHHDEREEGIIAPAVLSLVDIHAVKELVVRILCDQGRYASLSDEYAKHIIPTYRNFLSQEIIAKYSTEKALFRLTHHYNDHPVCQGRVSHSPPLHALCFQADPANLPLLSEFLKIPGVDVNRYHHDYAPLHSLTGYVAFNDVAMEDQISIQYMTVILNKGNNVNINIQELDSGNTPLHQAARNCRVALLRYMVEIPGIDLFAKNIAGKTPWQEARKFVVSDYSYHEKEERMKVKNEALQILEQAMQKQLAATSSRSSGTGTVLPCSQFPSTFWNTASKGGVQNEVKDDVVKKMVFAPCSTSRRS